MIKTEEFSMMSFIFLCVLRVLGLLRIKQRKEGFHVSVKRFPFFLPLMEQVSGANLNEAQRRLEVISFTQDL